MPKSYIAASNVGLSSIDALKDKASKYKMFNAEDWNSFSMRGELGNYLQILDEFDKTVTNFDEFQKKYDYSLGDLSSQSRIVAMMNELNKDLEMKEVRPGVFATNYDEVTNIIRNEITLNKADRYAKLQKQLMNLQTGWADFDNAMKAIPHKLSTSAINTVGDIERSIIALGNVMSAITSPAAYQQYSTRAADPTSVPDVLGAAYNAAYEDIQWDLDTTAAIDKFFDYEGWEYATGFAKWTASLSDSIGRMLPTFLMSVVGGKAVQAGSKLAGTVSLEAGTAAGAAPTLGAQFVGEALNLAGGLAGTSQVTYYMAMQASNYREMMANPNLCTRPTFELVANSAIRAGFEFAVEKILDKGFGTSALDSLAYGFSQAAQKSIVKTAEQTAVKQLTKASLKRIAVDALHEGLEEVLQDFSGNFTNLMFGFIDENYLETCDWSFQAMADAFFMGAIMSIGGSMLRVLKPILFKKDNNYTNVLKLDRNGNLILDKNGNPQFEKLNLFANYEYNLTIESFMESVSDFTQDYDNLSTDEKSDIMADLLQMFKTMTSIFGEFGNERYNKAKQILDTLSKASKKTDAQDVDSSTYEEHVKDLIELIADTTTEAHLHAIKTAKPELLKQFIENKIGPVTAVVNSKMSADEIRNLVGDASAETAKAYFKSGYESVAFSEGGTNIGTFSDYSLVVIPKQLSDNFTPETNVRTSVEQEIAKNMAASKEFVGLTKEIVRRYQAFIGDSNATSEQAFLAMLYNDQFQHVLLYSGDSTLIKLVDSLTTLYESTNKKGVEKDLLKQQIEIIKSRISQILFNYYLDQPNIDKAYINSSKTLSADQKRKLINMTWQKNIYTKIFNDDKYMPTDEDLSVLDRQIDNASYHPDGETWQESVRTMIHSKKHSVVVKGLKELNAYYKGIYTGRFNGQIYMPYDGSVANATFNAFCFAYNISIPELHSTNGLSSTDIDNIKTMYGEVNERTIFQYWNNVFQQEYGFQFKETRNKDVTTLTISEAAPAIEQRGKVTPTEFKSYIKTSDDPNRIVSYYTIGPSKAVPKAILSDNISPVERSVLTIDDVIKDPSLLNAKTQEEIKKASNGRLDTAAVFLYLREQYFKNSKGKSTIVISDDGSSYYVATIENTPAIMKDSFEKTGFAELEDARKKVSSGEKSVEVDPRDFVSKKVATMFSLDDGTSVLPKMYVRAFGDTSVPAEYDVIDNVIYVNSDFADFDSAHMYYYISHEFRHAIQSHNGEANGFDSNWLLNEQAKALTPKAQARVNAIVADLKAHYPELFAKLKKGISPIELASDLIYVLSTGESGAYGYDLDSSFYPMVVKMNEYGQVDSILTPWGSTYSSKGVTVSKQRVMSQAVQRNPAAVQVDTDKSYSSNEDAMGTNLKYYVKQADVEANRALKKEGKLPTGETVGMPIKNIVPNVKLRHLIVATTGRESNFDSDFIEDIKNARLRTNSDILNYLKAIKLDEYDESIRSGTAYARKVNFTLALIAHFYYGNEYFDSNTLNARAALEMSSSVDASQAYGCIYVIKKLIESPDTPEQGEQLETLLSKSRSWSATTKTILTTRNEFSKLFEKGMEKFVNEIDKDTGKEMRDLDIDFDSLTQAMLKRFDGSMASLYAILNSKRSSAIERAKRKESTDESDQTIQKLSLKPNVDDLDPENKSEDMIEYVQRTLVVQRLLKNEEWISTKDNKKADAIRRKIAADVEEEVFSWNSDKIEMVYYAITQSQDTEAAIDRINSTDEGTNKITEYRALRRNIMDRIRRFVLSKVKGMTKDELSNFVDRNPGLGIGKDGTFSIPSGYSDTSIATEIVKGMTIRELKTFCEEYLGSLKNKQKQQRQSLLVNEMLGKNPTRSNYVQAALSIVANMSKEAMSNFNAAHKAEVAELRKKYANKINKIGSTATVESAMAATRQAQDFETEVRTAFADWLNTKQAVTRAEREERMLLRKSNEAKQRKLKLYQEQVDTLVTKVQEATARLKEAKAKQNVQQVTAVISTDSTVTPPDVILPVLEPVYNRVRKTYTNVAYTDEVHFEQSWSDFISDFGDDLAKITVDDVDGILNFISKASVDLDNEEAVRSFYAVRQFLLMYLYKEHTDIDSPLKLSEEQVNRIERMFGTIAGAAGMNLRITAIADKIFTPASEKLKARATKLGIEFDEADLAELDLITQHDYTIDILKKRGAQSITDDIRREADQLKMTELLNLQTKMFEKASKKYKGKKKKWLDKVWEWERMAMLSSPGTWVRNALSNVLVEHSNKLSAVVGDAVFNVVDKLSNGKLRAKTPSDQYQIVHTKPTTQVSEFVNNTVIGSGFMDLIGESMAKQDVESFSNKTDSANDIVSAMIRRNIIGKILKDNRFDGKTWLGKGAADVGNWINGILYGTTKTVKNADGTETTKRTQGVLSDNKWVDKTFKYYLERMLTEDVAAGRIDLKQGLNSKAILEVITNAYIQASWDYMHKSNFFSDLEAKLREKAGAAGYFIYKQFSPFAAASWNWFVKALDYTPIGLVKSCIELANLEKKIQDVQQRRVPDSGRGEIMPTERLTSYLVKRKVGSGILGTVLFGVGVLLASVGAAGIDDDDDKIKLFVGPVSVSLDDVFGTSGLMMGMAMVSQLRKSTANQEELMSVVWKAFAETMNTAFDDSIFSDVLDMMQGSRTFVDILANKAVDTFFGAFVPNLFWTFLNYMTPVKPTYSGGLMGYIERGLVKTIPPIAWALPKRRDPYTGQLQYKYNMPWADGGAGVAGSVAAAITNWLLPIKVYNRKVSAAEEIAMSLGVSKGLLTGNYNDIGSLSTIEKDQLNEYYGGLNNTALNDFINNSVRYTVENKSGKRVELTYNKMTDDQRATTIKKIMNENSKYAKIYIATTVKGYKYYTRSKTEYEQLRKLGLTNVYLSAKPIVDNFVK